MTAVLHDGEVGPPPSPSDPSHPSVGTAAAVVDFGRLGPGDLRRLVAIVTVLARHGVLTAARTGGTFVLHPVHQPPRALAVALRRSFAELGPTFIKLGQLIASSPGLFPAFLATELRRLLDDVPPEPTARIVRTVECELGAPLDHVFAAFDRAPLAAASIAQVHRARLHDGTEVVVKVRRPRLRRRVERDLRLLRLLAAALGRLGALGEVANPVGIVEDLARSMGEELDFRREAADMSAFAANLAAFGTNERTLVPEAVAGLVGERVLVMTYVEGVPVDHGDTLRAAGHDLTELVRIGARAWIEGALVHGLFHGDVHAGNLFVTPDGKVAFLDFGIMGRLDQRTCAVLRRLLPALMIEGDHRAAMAAVVDLGAVRPGASVDLDRAGADVERLLGPLVAKPLGEVSYGEVLGGVLRVALDHHVRLPRELVALVKQLVYFERYAKDLAPDYRMFADPAVLEHLVAPPASAAPDLARPLLTARPRTRPLPAGVVVPREGEARFSWTYDGERPDLTRLYSKAKRSQWNASTDVDWSIEVDPLDTGGLADYLPLVAAASFERFSPREKAEAAHQFNAWITSQFLHGEQGALLATAKLVEQVPWVEAKHYGATQVMDEARHVEVYARYLQDKLELTYPVNDNLQQLLELIIADRRWDVTYLGMQIIVEGIALAAFGLIHQYSSEPLIKEITRYVMADEARHVAFGALSLAGVYDDMTAAERGDREDFVVEAAWLMRDRFLATEVWERLGIPLDDGLRDAARSPMLQLFQRILFAKITPNLRKIGLLSPDLAARLVAIGAMPPEDLAAV